MGLKARCIYCRRIIELPTGGVVPVWNYCEKCKKFMVTEFTEGEE